MPHDVLAFLGCVTIILGLFVSRAMMSIGMMILIGNAIFNLHLGENLRSFFKKPELLLLTGYFLLMSLSIFWSTDTGFYKERLQIMLPFLVLPFAFHSMNRLAIEWFDVLFMLFIALVCAGIGVSLIQYLQHKESYDLGYGFSKLIPTPFKNDHIRFSLAVVLSCCFAVDLMSRHSQLWKRRLLGWFIVYAVVYLHILSTKSGLVVFYLAAALFLIKLFVQKKYRKLGAMMLIGIATLPFLMYAVSSSLRNKIGYFMYSVSQMKNVQQDANVSDEGRLISYSYAIDCIQKHPVTGVGLGDVMNEMQTYYKKDFANRKVTVLLPHNQFLMVGMAIGIAGILYLIILQLVLLRKSYRHDFLSLIFWSIMFFAMMIEPLYETQYGTCMFLFFLLLLLQRRTKTE